MATLFHHSTDSSMYESTVFLNNFNKCKRIFAAMFGTHYSDDVFYVKHKIHF